MYFSCSYHANYNSFSSWLLTKQHLHKRHDQTKVSEEQYLQKQISGLLTDYYSHLHKHISYDTKQFFLFQGTRPVTDIPKKETKSSASQNLHFSTLFKSLNTLEGNRSLDQHAILRLHRAPCYKSIRSNSLTTDQILDKMF